MVTGGDFPPEYNGIALKGAYGGPFTSAATAKIEAFLSDPKEKHPGSSITPRKEITLVDFLPDYHSHLEALIDFSALGSFAENPEKTMLTCSLIQWGVQARPSSKMFLSVAVGGHRRLLR